MKVRNQLWYEAVQVVKRREDGSLCEWYPGDKAGTLAAARDEAIGLAKEFPSTEYQVIEMRLTEIGVPKIGKVGVVSARRELSEAAKYRRSASVS
jgi:hypothetical protein